MGKKLVRVRPPLYDGDITINRHCVNGVRFDREKGWYTVPEDLAKKLAKVHVHVEDSSSAFAFDVCDSMEEAQALEAERREEAARRASRGRDVRPTEIGEDVTPIGELPTAPSAALRDALRPPPAAPEKAHPVVLPLPASVTTPVPPAETVEEIAAAAEDENAAAGVAPAAVPAVKPEGKPRRVTRAKPA